MVARGGEQRWGRGVLRTLRLSQVLIDIDGKHEWRDCIDVPGVRLPRGYYFGTSSITGDLSGTAPGRPAASPAALAAPGARFPAPNALELRAGASICGSVPAPAQTDAAPGTRPGSGLHTPRAVTRLSPREGTASVSERSLPVPLAPVSPRCTAFGGCQAQFERFPSKSSSMAGTWPRCWLPAEIPSLSWISARSWGALTVPHPSLRRVSRAA